MLEVQRPDRWPARPGAANGTKSSFGTSDGKIHSISGSYWFDERRSRAIGVHPAYMRTALEKAYGAKALLEEIDRC